MDSNDNSRPPFDRVIQTITEYVFDYEISSQNAWNRARVALLDSMACAIEGVPACDAFIGPYIKGTIVPGGFPLPGTPHILDPLKAAFDLGSLIRYLDHSDAFPGAEWGHPSDNIGAILPVADWLSRAGDETMTMKNVLECIIKAYEIQGCFQIKNAFNKVGLDHVILVKISATAVLSKLVGLTRAQTNDAISQAFADGQALRIYRQSPNTSPRKGWAGGDACMRAVHLVLMTKAGQPGFPSVLTAPKWGFYDTSFNGNTFSLPIPFSSMVVENHLIKLVAAEGHAITAIEASLILARQLEGRLDNISKIRIRTTEASMIIIDKTGVLHNAADRDHCMRYMVALSLLKGDWPEPHDYEDNSEWAYNPRVVELRSKITMEEDVKFTRDYHDPKVRTVASGITITMTTGEVLEEVLVEYPVGHSWREDTIDRAKIKFVNLTHKTLEGPAKLWEDCMENSFLSVKVRDWVDIFAGRLESRL